MGLWYHAEVGFSRLALLKGWCWTVCVVLIVIGAIGLFSENIGPLPTNRIHGLVLNLGLGFVGFGFVRFGAERPFVLYSGIAMAALGILGFVPSVRPWLYETFHLETESSYIELSSGAISLVVWALARGEPDPPSA
jgi:hypothetical protein